MELNKHGASGPETESVTFAFGHCVGAGIQALLSGKTEDEAIWAAFLNWNYYLFGTEDDERNPAKKSFAWAVHAIKKFIPYARTIHREWEIAMFDGKPAVELSFILDLQNGYFYRAYIDIVLRHRKTGELLVVELKTTKMKRVQEAMYGNSSQALSYSVALDKIASGNASFHVWYIVYKTEDEEFEFLPFTKNMLEKADWIQSLLLDTEEIERYRAAKHFPKFDHSCIQFNRPCVYYGICGLRTGLIASELELAERVEKELKEEYTFRFTLQEVIDQQLEKV